MFVVEHNNAVTNIFELQKQKNNFKTNIESCRYIICMYEYSIWLYGEMIMRKTNK